MQNQIGEPMMSVSSTLGLIEREICRPLVVKVVAVFCDSELLLQYVVAGRTGDLYSDSEVVDIWA